MTVTDYQCHWYPEAFYELVRGRDRYPRVARDGEIWRFEAAPGVVWSFSSEALSIENYFARLDAAGIDVGVASPNMVGDVTRLAVPEAREITLQESASPDAPVIQYTYGPRAEETLGGQISLLNHLSVDALVSLQNADSGDPLANQLARTLIVFTGTRTLHPHWLAGTLELALGVGNAWATELGGFRLQDYLPPNAIPFGGSGTFISIGAAWQRRVRSFDLAVQLGERVDVPALLILFGQRPAADAVADYLHDGLVQEPALDASLRWELSPRYRAIFALHGDLRVPEDQQAQTTGFARAMAGLGTRCHAE